MGSALALIFNLGSNLLLLPRYGYLGASVLTVVTEALLVSFYLFHLQRSFLRLPLFKKMASLALSGGVMAITFWAFKSLPVGYVLFDRPKLLCGSADTIPSAGLGGLAIG